MSPVAWRHVNLFGTFDFNPAAAMVDIDALVARYADPACWINALHEKSDADLA
jgi:hypothetical protein